MVWHVCMYYDTAKIWPVIRIYKSNADMYNIGCDTVFIESGSVLLLVCANHCKGGGNVSCGMYVLCTLRKRDRDYADVLCTPCKLRKRAGCVGKTTYVPMLPCSRSMWGRISSPLTIRCM